MDSKIEHLKMIQGVINRMSINSFLLKGWSVVFVTALFALAANNSNVSFIYIAYFPALAFWALDGYFLWQEKLYRKKYDKVSEKDNSAIDFSMDTSSVSNEVDSWDKVVFSKTLRLFHGSVIATILIVMLVVIF